MIKLNNKKGFTLIELMIVIAIIGILAAIAIPNFIEYRNKGFCSRAESDANSIAAALSDYFAIPAHTTLPAFVATNNSAAVAGSLNVALSGANTGTLGGTAAAIVITVTDVSGRCPQKYRDAMAYIANQKDGWNGLIHTKYMTAN